MEKTVAVIGGSGFIGRAIVEKLTGEGARVIVLCRNAEKAKYLKTQQNEMLLWLTSSAD